EESLDLDLERSNRQVWLVRLPMFLAEKWRDRNNLHGQELGKIRINKDGSKITLLLNENDNDSIPHEYDLELTKKVVENEYVFTEQNLKKTAIVGTVCHECQVMPSSIRMPKKEILDYLFKLFDEYDYWSLKGLKERTRQPEAHLKECLDKVATLVKKGPYAFKYTLRPEYKKLK
uniref:TRANSCRIPTION INITIATION FACTOR IIF SUBUNIT BETA, TFG2 n=1 Tax=Saccharomyces cerevisiae TaxID=4932 RepID=UPI000718ABB2|nr:Chain V, TRANSCRIPTION INITIATION FACTOR IIF SUBUNIT BETA, TFG2 [Saccharomyces cerevisiae]